MEPKIKNEDAIYSFLQTNQGADIETIQHATGIFKLSIHKATEQ